MSALRAAAVDPVGSPPNLTGEDDAPQTPSGKPSVRFSPKELSLLHFPSSDAGLEESVSSTSTDTKNENDVVQRVRSELRVVEARAPRSWLRVLQKWEGIVDKITDDEIEATLRDLTDPEREEEVVALSIDEIPPGDRPLLLPGAVFYWVIGYRESLDGGRKRESEIRLRRLPYTRKQLEDARHRAHTLRAQLGWK